MSSLSIIPDPWYPVFAEPIDWYDQLKDKTTLFTSEINFAEPEGSFGHQFTIINEQADQGLVWNAQGKDGQPVTFGMKSGTGLSSIGFKFIIVQLNRPWFNLELFNLSGWKLGGQPQGFISNGDANNNDGVFTSLSYFAYYSY